MAASINPGMMKNKSELDLKNMRESALERFYKTDELVKKLGHNVDYHVVRRLIEPLASRHCATTSLTIDGSSDEERKMEPDTMLILLRRMRHRRIPYPIPARKAFSA